MRVTFRDGSSRGRGRGRNTHRNPKETERDRWERMVSRPGKFEGEMPFSPYYHQQSMEAADEEWGEFDEEGARTVVYVFQIDSLDAMVFPELEDRIGERLFFTEDDNGFWYQVRESWLNGLERIS